MSITWFRSYHGAPFDTKLNVVAKRANVTRGFAAAIWWAVLDCASQAEVRGNVSAINSEEIAAAFDFDETEVIAVLDAMKLKGLLIGENDSLPLDQDGALPNWPKRQDQPRKIDTGSAARGRAYRAREKEKRQSQKVGLPAEALPSLPVKAAETAPRQEPLMFPSKAKPSIEPSAEPAVAQRDEPGYEGLNEFYIDYGRKSGFKLTAGNYKRSKEEWGRKDFAGRRGALIFITEYTEDRHRRGIGCHAPENYLREELWTAVSMGPSPERKPASSVSTIKQVRQRSAEEIA